MADTDRELLEMAAKAAGFAWGKQDDHPDRIELYLLPLSKENLYTPWNPLTDDGDALRLAVRLRMRVESWGSGASAVVSVDNRAFVAEPHYGDDPERATRRAIVRAAAAIGRSMP